MLVLHMLKGTCSNWKRSILNFPLRLVWRPVSLQAVISIRAIVAANKCTDKHKDECTDFYVINLFCTVQCIHTTSIAVRVLNQQ